ncbi:hypothetical protein [Flavobacterium psychrotrophum]|uniref:hypothetical protein n=1 Tax=Flavobacterium psychrotrophum TaxID=2294119 RepID=UPI000E30B633|nr:hypothetical protein [Flavobacterium psychrotrophum]
MSEDIFKTEEAFQQYLNEGDYTFVGPVNQDLLGIFTFSANLALPGSQKESIHNALSNKQAIKDVLPGLPEGTPLRVYVVFGSIPNALSYTTTEDYRQNSGELQA